MKDTHPILAREGWPHVGVAALLLCVATVAQPWLALPFGLLLVFVVQFFRDPHREVPTGEGLVVAPADGRVIQVGPAPDPLHDRQAVKVSVFMNVFNVHSNRAPANGEISVIKYRQGSFVNADLDKASDANEANFLGIQTSRGELTCVQIAGLVARRIICYVRAGETVERGQRFGFIRFGSRVDVYLPTDCDIKVGIGDKVTAGVDVIAELAELGKDDG